MSLQAGQRVRPTGTVSDEIAKEGSGTIRCMEGEIALVDWDMVYGNTLLVREDPKTLVVVDAKCSYAKEQWKRGTPWGIEGMIIVCDIHGAPANVEVYDVDEVASVTSLCQRYPGIN